MALGTKAVSVCCAVGMAGYMLWQCRLFATTTMLAGINGQYAALAAGLPEDELAITEDANIASVLKYVYQRPVYLRNNTQREIEQIYEQGLEPLSATPLRFDAVEEYLEKYGKLYIIGDPGHFWQMGAIERVYDSVLAGNYPEESIGSYPIALERWEIDVAVYRLTPSNEAKSFDFLRGQAMGRGATRDENWNISIAMPDVAFYGPYTSLKAGSYRLEIDLSGAEAFDAVLDIQIDLGTKILARESFAEPGTYTIEFTLEKELEGLEFSLKSNSDALLTCTRLELFEVEG